MSTQTVIPIMGYVAPRILIELAARELSAANVAQWQEEAEHRRTVAARYYHEAAQQFWAMRGRS